MYMVYNKRCLILHVQSYHLRNCLQSIRPAPADDVFSRLDQLPSRIIRSWRSLYQRSYPAIHLPLNL